MVQFWFTDLNNAYLDKTVDDQLAELYQYTDQIVTHKHLF